MAVHKKALFQFDTEEDTGILQTGIGGVILVVSYLGNGPKLFQTQNLTGIISSTTIKQAVVNGNIRGVSNGLKLADIVDLPSEVVYLSGVTSPIQVQIDAIKSSVGNINLQIASVESGVSYASQLKFQ